MTTQPQDMSSGPKSPASGEITGQPSHSGPGNGQGQDGHGQGGSSKKVHRKGRLTPLRSLIEGLVIPLMAIVIALVAIVVVTTNWSSWIGTATIQETDNAQIKANISQIASRIAGTITKMNVHDFQKVKAGDVLMEIDPSVYRAQQLQAQANVSLAEAQLDNIDNQIALQKANIIQAKAALASAQAQEHEADLEHTRQKTLLAKGAGTKRSFEQALAAHISAQADLDSAHAKAQAAQHQLQIYFGDKKRLEASVAAAHAALDVATLNLGYTKITAPVDGMVGQRKTQLGNYVSAGTNLIAIVPLPHVYVIANYKETQLPNVAPHQPVKITVDGLPGQTFRGEVEQVSPASGSQFALLPADNATGNFTKIVQRIPVRIDFAPNQSGLDRLRPGMSVITAIDTKKQNSSLVAK